MKHWLEEQELMRSYLNFRGFWDNPLTYGFRNPVIRGNSTLNSRCYLKAIYDAGCPNPPEAPKTLIVFIRITYCHLFPHYLIKGTIFGKKNIEYNM